MQDQWFAEPIRVISLGGPDFIPNPKDFPVLDRFVRDYLYRLMRLIPRPSILLSDIQEPLPPPSDGLQSAKIPSNGTLLSLGAFDSSDTSNSTDPQRVSQDPTPAEAAALPSQRKQQAFHPTPYLSYVRWAERNQPDLPLISMFGTGYQDYLQTPLQPLTDNLESVTYEVFEKDPIKYSWYEKAITLALLDWQAMERPGSGPSGSITIAVVGAGRGPLVTRALRASQAAGVSVDLWALEKNPNAFLLLQSQNGASYDLQAEPPGWAGRVHLVQADMRSWQGPEYIGDPGRPSDPEFFNDEGSLPMRQSRIDILVSELLGSFGDNELSPECLDGVRHLMGPQSISIPSEYSAHISPLTTPKLHADLLGKSGSGLPDAMMTPYVVMLHACFSPSTTQYQQIWSFEHKFWTEVDDDQAQPSLNAQQPAQGYLANRHNTRASVRRFPCPTRGVIHGIAGYFEAVLYGDVELSTRPDTIEQKSRDMTSWFPIFFPIKVGHCACKDDD